MQTIGTPSPRRRLAAGADGSGAAKLILFFIGAYALAWLPFAVPILAARGLILLPAPETVFLTLATLGIGLAGVGMAAWESGGAGVRSLLGQILRWRVRPIWYVAAVLVPALFPAGAFLLGLALGNPPTPTASPQVWLSIPLVLVAFLVPALLEENGWPMPWNAALQALPDQRRGVAVADFHVLITLATVVVAVLVVLATRRPSRADTRQTPLDGMRAAAPLD